MAEHHEIPAPSEMVYTPRSSWAPVFFAAGTALAICGIFSHFLVSSYIYSIIGIVVLLAALRAFVSSSVRDFFSLPKRQKIRGAVLPAATLKSAGRDSSSS